MTIPAELVSELGERAREAASALLAASSAALDLLDKPGPARVPLRDMYVAATRIVMRNVAALFIEPRPGGRAALSFSRGGLFTPGEFRSKDPVLRAQAALEERENVPQLRALLTRGGAGVRRGRAGVWASAVVDFSVLPPEHLGILYEGLLEDELRRVGGDFQVVRSDGARKGTGTFYTRPDLAGPTVRRALEPLAYETASRSGRLVPKKTEEILALAVCDPAMGSGTFLIAALRYLSNALSESSQHHGGALRGAQPGRSVAASCLYGVDLDPLAVELGKIALWIEAADPLLPLAFMDRNLKCGNALVGCWLDRFEDYPILAWEREGGDTKHAGFVHHFRETGAGTKAGDKWTAAIKERREREIKPALRCWLENRFGRTNPEPAAEEAPTISHADRLAGEGIRALRQAFDTWCALWFWPGDEIEKAPDPLHFPTEDAEALDVVRRVAEEIRFFHWELEFPEVFTRPASGFDAVVGNPPWEIQKPSSVEFFSRLDPLYRTYGKQEALRAQMGHFQALGGAEVEETWLSYNARFKALSSWVRSVAYPFGAEGEAGAVLSLGKGTEPLLRAWRVKRAARRGFADPAHPFRYQGSADLNAYKMFLEVAHATLAPGGCLGFLVPAGIYTDDGTRELRRLFLKECAWTHLYAFQNERFVFENIHHSFKMAVIHVRKGGETAEVATRFRLGPGDSPEPQEIEADLLDTSRYLRPRAADIARYSPSSAALLEVTSENDERILGKLYENGALLGDADPRGARIEHSRELDMTTDSRLFSPRPRWEAAGYAPDVYGFWHAKSGKIALPLYQGIMIRPFEPSAKSWVSGTGLRAVWEPAPVEGGGARPQYLMSLEAARASGIDEKGWKLAYRPIARSTDTRTFIGCVLPPLPAGNSISFLLSEPERPSAALALSAVLNGFVYDWALRSRLGGTNLNNFVLAETPVARGDAKVHEALALMALRLTGTMTCFAGAWSIVAGHPRAWRTLWAVTAHERLRLRVILDAVVAKLYGLDLDDFSWILRGCDHPAETIVDKPFSRTLDPKGFWRVDKRRAPELRHPVLALVAFHALERMGMGAFLAQNEGEGFFLPETLRLADYGLGHDARAKTHQPVAARLGPRFLPWQLEQGAEASWAECNRHAETIEKILGGTSAAAVGADGVPW